MPARLTPAQARALGIINTLPIVPARKRKDRRTARGPYRTECVDCAETLTSQAAETRHAEQSGHRRYQLVLIFDTTPPPYAAAMTPDDPGEVPPDPDEPDDDTAET